MMHAHLIGIGGSGLSAIGRLLIEKGYQVSGSDLELSSYARELEDLGAKVFIGHKPDQIEGVDLVLRSSAIPENNVEVIAAKEKGIPVYKRSEFLGKITADFVCLAIAGSHGKTTTTAMISWMLTALDQDPSYLIGSKSNNLSTNAHAGDGPVFVIEADEYDYMFLGLEPQIAVITNIEHDHPDCFPTEKDFYDAFVRFVRQMDGNGKLIACRDDTLTARLIEYTERNLDITSYTYGLEIGEDRFEPGFIARNLMLNQLGGYDFDVYLAQDFLTRISLKVPGVHNVYNATASLAVAHLLELPVESAAQSLSDFKGTERRFELLAEISGIAVIDDYAHHPTEIEATIDAARKRYPDRALWAVWQPHTYTRIEVLFKDYLTAFEAADHVLVTEIFASREAKRNDYSAQKIVDSMQHQDVHYLESNAFVVDYLFDHLKPGDVVLVLSAGDANQISLQLVDKLSRNGSGAVRRNKDA
jgi:UDP-N-acetylmuramate--alanine ligase